MRTTGIVMLVVAGAVLAGIPASAQVSVNVNIGPPPVIFAAPPRVVVMVPPRYYKVPPGHAKAFAHGERHGHGRGHEHGRHDR
jgi:hypothetical protein